MAGLDWLFGCYVSLLCFMSTKPPADPDDGRLTVLLLLAGFLVLVVVFAVMAAWPRKGE